MVAEVARQLLDSFARIVRSDGGSIEIVSAENDRIVVAYAAGADEECESGACVLPHLELQEMMREWLSRRAPGCSVVVTLVRPQA
jgi:Fe-S cluster biogenesis protein NfuA